MRWQNVTSIQVALVILVLVRFKIFNHCIHLSRNKYKVKLASEPLQSQREEAWSANQFECYRLWQKQTTETLLGKLLNLGLHFYKCKQAKPIGCTKISSFSSYSVLSDLHAINFNLNFHHSFKIICYNTFSSCQNLDQFHGLIWWYMDLQVPVKTIFLVKSVP